MDNIYNLLGETEYFFKKIELERKILNKIQFKKMILETKKEDIKVDINGNKEIFGIKESTYKDWKKMSSKNLRFIPDVEIDYLNKISKEKFNGKFTFYKNNEDFYKDKFDKMFDEIFNKYEIIRSKCVWRSQYYKIELLSTFFPFEKEFYFHDNIIQEKFNRAKSIHEGLFISHDDHYDMSKIDECKKLYIEIYEYLLSENNNSKNNKKQEYINQILTNLFSIVFFEYFISNYFLTLNNKKWIEIIKNNKGVYEYFDYYYFLGLVFGIFQNSYGNAAFYLEMKSMYNKPLFELERFIYINSK